jgi:multidrug efflux system outer membrane protein
MESALRERDAARAALVLRVSRLYFDVVKQQRLNVAIGQAAQRAAAMRESSEARTRVGLATELDVLRARTLEARAAASQAEGRRALANAIDQLALAIGRPLGSPLRVEEEIAPLAAADSLDDLPESLDDLIAIALAERIDVQNARAAFADARRAATVARWNVLPPLALDVSYTQRGLAGSSSGFNDLFNGWHVGVSTSYSLDRASENAVIETAAVSVDAASRAIAQLEQRVAADVRALYSAWHTSAASIVIQRDAAQLAAQERDLAQLRFERGLASSLDVVAAETSVYQAETTLIAAELDRKIIALDLRRAVGRLNVEMFEK